VFLREQAIEVEFEGKKYYIINQAAVLMVERNELREE